MKRRDFIHFTGFSLGAAFLSNIPVFGNVVSPDEFLTPFDADLHKRMADMVLAEAKWKGAAYADVRIGRYMRQYIITREQNVESITNAESYGIGIRVLANGSWGFAATDKLDNSNILKATTTAVDMAKVNAKLLSEPVILAPQKGYGEVSWRTPIVKNGFEIPIKEKVELLLHANDIAIKSGASFINNALYLVNEQKYFASTEGSYINQNIHRIWPTFTVTKTDTKTGKFETRNSLSAPMGMGYEYLVPREEDKIKGIVTVYNKRYDMLEDVKAAALQADEKLKAKPVEPGKYDLVLDPTNLFLTIHESVGHPTELDRVLGYEANYAGTSFLTLDKWESKKFNFGSKFVNIVADKTQPGSLGAVGYDDEGVKTKDWDLIKDGILVNYQTTRDQAHIIGLNESQGCSYADNWSAVQFQRMPNVSLQPGQDQLKVADMIKNVEKGLYMLGRNSYSIDQQRYNFQFSSQLCYEIKNGKIAGMVKDAAYQANTQEFWNACTAICDKSDYRLGGSFFDGKGQPSQVSAVSHGCCTTRFNGISVINTGRKI